MSRVRILIRTAYANRGDIADWIADAIGAASIPGLLVMLCFIGEVFR